MSAAYHSRIQRLRRLEALLPPVTTAPADCPDGTRLLDALTDAYGAGDKPARRRALQRDLEELIKVGRVKAVNPGSKPLRFRRRRHAGTFCRRPDKGESGCCSGGIGFSLWGVQHSADQGVSPRQGN